MKKRILITGANGFIGSSILKYWDREQYDLFAWGTRCEKVDNIEIKPVNLNCLLDVKMGLKEIAPDIIIHCAGRADVNTSIEQPIEDLEGNVIITYNMLLALKELDMQQCRFIYPSSAAVYGNPDTLPISEEQMLAPMSPYALHKQMAEAACHYFNTMYGIDIVILRIFSTYGPGLKKQIFWDMNEKIRKNGSLCLYGTGEETRDFIYITDLMNIIVLIAETKKLQYRVYNVANGQETSIRELAQRVSQFQGLEYSKVSFNSLSRSGNPRNWKADISRIRELGYEPQISLEKGIKSYCEWFNAL